MKKILSAFLCIVLVLSLFSVNVFADKRENGYKERVFEAIHNMETEVNLDQYDVQVGVVIDYLNEVFSQYPEYNYLASFGGTQNDKGEFIKLELSYRITREQMLSEREFIDNTLAPVINDVQKKWSDTQKALYVHDWICANFMYDYRLFEEPGRENHDIVGFLQDGMGVCQSYAYTYMYILRKIGIEAYYVISETDSHGWNVINIDGNWYHVDVTHDDPIIGYTYHYDYMGEVRHDKFLLSDSEIIADGNHDDFYIPQIEGITCNEYDGNDSWRDAVSSVLEVDGYWYYLDNSGNAGGLMKTKDFENTERLMEIGKYVEQWDAYGWSIGNTTYSGYYTGLFEYNEHLFFTDANDIYVYDTHHKKFNKLPVDRPEELHYFGLRMDGKTLTYLTSDSNIREHVVTGTYTLGAHMLTDWEVIKEATETEAGEKVKYCYFCGEIIERQSIPAIGNVRAGDTDGDGKIDTSDLAVEKLFLAGAYDGEICGGADFNFDGKIDTSDLAALKLCLAGL